MKFFVHVHVYYPQLWEELKACLLNLAPHSFDLVVTMVEEHREICEDIKRTFPQARIEMVENRGYDVWPFLSVLNRINLDDYTFVIKLHTKRDVPKGGAAFFRDGSTWRRHLLSLLSSRERFERVLKKFDSDPTFGLHGAYAVIDTKVNDTTILSAITQRCGCLIPFCYVAGTMFICRAKCLKGMQALGLTAADFSDPLDHQTVSLAHVCETLFGYFTYRDGYTVGDATCPYWRLKAGCRVKVLTLLLKTRLFFFYKKQTASGKIMIKICKIPVWRKKMV